METVNLAELYDAPPMESARVTARLDEGLEQAPGSGSGPTALARLPDHPAVGVRRADRGALRRHAVEVLSPATYPPVTPPAIRRGLPTVEA